MVEIIPITLGVDTCYVLKGDGVVVVDAGAPGKAAQFARGLARAGISARDVRLIVATHGHWDHVGSARDLKTLTGAPLAMHEADRACVERSLTTLPPGVTAWGKAFLAILRLFMPFIRVPSATVEIVLGDAPFSLEQYGVSGRILHTPGHSAGSVSVLLDSGEAFVGDLAMNGFPLRMTPGLPILADDPSAVVASWRRLLDEGVRQIYPAHGKPFSADVIRRAIAA